MKKLLKRETKKLFRGFSDPIFFYLTIVGNSILILATLAVYYLEKGAEHPQIKTYFESLWWGISTITTVGYGDVLPQTFWGRIIGIILMYTGTVLFISFTGIVLKILLKDEVEEEMAPLKKELNLEEKELMRFEKTLQDIVQRLDRLEKK